MKVTIEVNSNNAGNFPDRYVHTSIKVDANERHRGSNVITKGLVESCGQAALKIVEATKR